MASACIWRSKCPDRCGRRLLRRGLYRKESWLTVKIPLLWYRRIAFGVIRSNRLRSSAASANSVQAILNGQYGQCLLRTTGGAWAGESVDQPLIWLTIDLTVLYLGCRLILWRSPSTVTRYPAAGVLP